MSEQTKEPDIVERLEAAFTPSKSGVLPSRKLYREAAGEITRLRAERPGWREPTAVMLDAMQAECPEIGRHYLRAIWRVGFAALHPSVWEHKGCLLDGVRCDKNWNRRAERPGWREAAERIVRIKDWNHDEDGQARREYDNAAEALRVALHPSVAEPDAPKEEQTCEHEWSEWAKVGRHVERKCSKCGKEQYDD